MAFAQFLLIWNGNLADETPWYIPRMQGGWGWVSGAIMLFHFALPFVALLFRAVKRDPRRLAAVAGLVLAARVLEAPWMVLPALHDGPMARHSAQRAGICRTGRALDRRPAVGGRPLA